MYPIFYPCYGTKDFVVRSKSIAGAGIASEGGVREVRTCQFLRVR